MNNTDEIVKMLNHALAADPEAMKAVFKTRVKCNEDLADDPFIVVTEDLTVSPLGIINGVLNLLGENRIASVNDDKTGEFQGFVKYE